MTDERALGDAQPQMTAEELFEKLWITFGREVSVSFARRRANEQFPWSVMVEGDVGSYGGISLVDALQHRLESSKPEREAGWGTDAH